MKTPSTAILLGLAVFAAPCASRPQTAPETASSSPGNAPTCSAMESPPPSIGAGGGSFLSIRNIRPISFGLARYHRGASNEVATQYGKFSALTFVFSLDIQNSGHRTADDVKYKARIVFSDDTGPKLLSYYMNYETIYPSRQQQHLVLGSMSTRYGVIFNEIIPPGKYVNEGPLLLFCAGYHDKGVVNVEHESCYSYLLTGPDHEKIVSGRDYGGSSLNLTRECSLFQ